MRVAGLRTALWVLATVAVLAGPVPLALGATDEITAVAGDAFTGGSGAGDTDFLLDAGSNPTFVNADGVDSHNVVAVDDGPDREPLFSTGLIRNGGSTVVPGTQYLTPGTYRFLCTIHVGMEGTLSVSGPGAVPRPDVALEIASSRLRKVARGSLAVRLSAVAAAADVSLVARLGARTLGGRDGIDLAAGETRTEVIPLDRKARKLLAEGRRAKVVVSATIPYGSPRSAKRTLR